MPSLLAHLRLTSWVLPELRNICLIQVDFLPVRCWTSSPNKVRINLDWGNFHCCSSSSPHLSYHGNVIQYLSKCGIPMKLSPSHFRFWSKFPYSTHSIQVLFFNSKSNNKRVVYKVSNINCELNGTVCKFIVEYARNFQPTLRKQWKRLNQKFTTRETGQWHDPWVT